MKLPGPADKHLTYCLNIHPGETWAENFAAIRDQAMRVRDAVAPREPFGLGLRLSAKAAEQLARPEPLGELRKFLDDHGLYAFTINGFPFGQFHAKAVKEDVYRPDWRSPRRREYTNRLVDILATLLPEGAGGSISTVPGSYGPWIASPDDKLRMAAMLTASAAYADTVRRETGKDICIALEPEPDCFVETTNQALAYLTTDLPDAARTVAREVNLDGDAAVEILRRHVGICLDTAHAAVEFEDPAASLARLIEAKVRVGKVQLSSALRLTPTPEALTKLDAFVDPVYLHQVRLRGPDGSVESFADLPDAIAAARSRDNAADCELRVHFHVPLFFTEAGPLASTSDLLGPGLWRGLGDASSCKHLEIETYTFDVLPRNLRPADVVESIRHEYAWVLAQWAAALEG